MKAEKTGRGSLSMIEGTPWKHIVRFAIPVLLGSLLQQLYNTVDTIIVGKFSGQDPLSAGGLVLQFLINRTLLLASFRDSTDSKILSVARYAYVF